MLNIARLNHSKLKNIYLENDTNECKTYIIYFEYKFKYMNYKYLIFRIISEISVHNFEM